jgi:hypothetical protein
VTDTKVPTVPLGNRFPRECTLLSGINHLASGCGINAEKSLVFPRPTFRKSAISRRISKEVAELQAAGLAETLIRIK